MHNPTKCENSGDFMKHAGSAFQSLLSPLWNKRMGGFIQPASFHFLGLTNGRGGNDVFRSWRENQRHVALDFN